MSSRNYLIIGGGSGIGQAVLEELVKEGHQVWAGSRSAESTIALPGVNAFTYDVSSDEDLADYLPDHLDGLVYCPGSINLKPFARIKPEDFHAEMNLNFMGAVKVIQAALPALKKSEKASVVLYSTVAVQLGLPFHSSIAAAKGAVEGLTRSLAAEFAPKIRFNAIAPSLTDTPLASSLLSNDKKREANAERHPLKAVGTPQDIAAMSLFLLSDQSAWISGQVLKVDGGMSSIKPM